MAHFCFVFEYHSRLTICGAFDLGGCRVQQSLFTQRDRTVRRTQYRPALRLSLAPHVSRKSRI